MKYSRGIFFLFFLSFLSIISLLYLSKVNRDIEKSNFILKSKINIIKHQININEIEYSLFSSYEYLTKLQKLYLENFDNGISNRISFVDFKRKDKDNIFNVGIK